MKFILKCAIAIIVCSFVACSKSDDSREEHQEIIDEFIAITPDSWEGEVLTDAYTHRDTVWYAPVEPEFVIKYTKPSVTYKNYYGEDMQPQLVLNFFDISAKDELVDLVIDQMDYHWCITWYFGETDQYMILTSPCFVNHGDFGNDHHLDDLYSSLKGVIEVEDHFSPDYIYIPFW